MIDCYFLLWLGAQTIRELAPHEVVVVCDVVADLHCLFERNKIVMVSSTEEALFWLSAFMIQLQK